MAKSPKTVQYEMTSSIRETSQESVHVSIVDARYALCGYENPIARLVLFTGDPTCPKCLKKAKDIGAEVRRK